MPHQSQTGQARWQHRPAQGFLRKALPAKRSDYASGNDLLLSSLADMAIPFILTAATLLSGQSRMVLN